MGARWREATSFERKAYEDQAMEEKQRYVNECMARDVEISAQQDLRRQQHNSLSQDTRMRHTTMASSSEATRKSDVPKRKREMTEEEVEERNHRRQVG